MMSQETNQVKERYEVHCFSCKSPFDAAEVPWCSCLATTRTLVCPACLTCFCQAPASYKRAFWATAPPSLWKSKFASGGGEVPSPDLPATYQIPHPLVLVVDDEKEIQQVAKLAVESLGYHVIMAKNGQEALELAATYRPDLILTDALMPRVDGREVCRRLKEGPETRSIKTVVMTSTYTASKYKSEALKSFHVDDYLVKPVEFRTLRELLQRHLG